MLCYQELPSGEWLRFIGQIFRLFPTPLAFDALHPLEKTRMAGLQSGEGCIMIDSVVRVQYINVTDTRQPRRHSKCRANALRLEAKVVINDFFKSHISTSFFVDFFSNSVIQIS